MERPKLYFIIVIFSILFIISGLVKTARSLPLFSLYQNIKAEGMHYEFDNVVRVEQIMPLSPAADSQLKVGDIIVIADGINIDKTNDFIDIVYKNRGKSINIIIERNGEFKQIQLTPKIDSLPGGGYAGAAISDLKIQKEPAYKESVFVVIPKTLLQNISWDIFTAPVLKDQMVGPAGIATGLSLQKDYFRPFNFALGMIFIILAIGLIKLKKWSLYGIYFFIFLALVEMIINFSSMIQLDYFSVFLIISFIISILFVYYLYSQRKFFV